MTLGDAQREFAVHIAYLIQHIDAMGYSVTFGDAYRDPRSHKPMGEKGPYGQAFSAHKQRLAVDLNLFDERDRYVKDITPAYTDIGEYWESMDDQNVWGGRFSDPNHFSRRFNGIA
jgi:hypothetical protein